MAQEDRRDSVFDSAADVFAAYGYRRTSMNDIAKAAGISRPALYLMFSNKEDLFRQLTTFRQNQAIDGAAKALTGDGTISERIPAAIQAYEAIYYEPVSTSPHGEELMDVNMSIASEDMQKGHDRLIGTLADSIDAAVKAGEARLPDIGLGTRQYVELLMASITGQKKSATSKRDFRRKVRSVISVFMMPFEIQDNPAKKKRRQA
ncbi:TetR/AcrR family transcriptional regulator [Parasphingopyxis sp. CP4]|uniref:TetR/AcrR family transcriptional regulator n=1 Tax=Parasphingopyxis sp. CP4 TaxID=2724527 RepID=UPI0015A0EECD|nr:TetR/AcrR family transcriptional regulator [Parasphingopyxis sp. CP4]QLC22286.1 TetR/AcrR family transcriptional regulator [Parasphingopyxis sp. CP4]